MSGKNLEELRLSSRAARRLMQPSSLEVSWSTKSFVATNSANSDNGSSIGGIIESGTVTSETWDLLLELCFSKNNEQYCKYFLIAVK